MPKYVAIFCPEKLGPLEYISDSAMFCISPFSPTVVYVGETESEQKVLDQIKKAHPELEQNRLLCFEVKKQN